jgi:hypothetical protein
LSRKYFGKMPDVGLQVVLIPAVIYVVETAAVPCALKSLMAA